MIYYAAALLSPVLLSISSIIGSYFTNNLFKKPANVVFFTNITTLIFTLPLIYIIGKPSVPEKPVIFAMSIIALTTIFHLILWYSVLKKADTSISVAMTALGRITLPIFAWIIVGEKLQPIQYIGFGIILLPSIFLNLDIKKMTINVAFWLMLLVSVIISLQTILRKFSVINTDFITSFFWTILLTNLICLTMLFLPSARRDIADDFPVFKKKIPLFILNDWFLTFGGLASLFALSQLPALIVSSVGSTRAIFTLFFGFILLKIFKDKSKEDFSRGSVIKKLLSFAFIILGIYLVLGGWKL